MPNGHLGVTKEAAVGLGTPLSSIGLWPQLGRGWPVRSDTVQKTAVTRLAAVLGRPRVAIDETAAKRGHDCIRLFVDGDALQACQVQARHGLRYSL